MRYYCTTCGSQNVRMKTKSNYGIALAVLDLALFALAIPTYGVSLIGCVIIACCVKKRRVCRECGNENCLIPMTSPQAQALMSRQSTATCQPPAA